MKKIILFTILFSGLNTMIAQSVASISNCSPRAWCNKTDLNVFDKFSENFTAPGDIAGIISECGSTNPSCVFAEWFACGYSANTPQGTLCKETKLNNDATTEVLSSLQTGITAERIFKFYDKTKRGAIVHKYSNGYTLRLAIKLQNKQRAGLNFILAFKIVDNKNKTLANPIVYVAPSKNKKGYLILKSDKSLLDYEWIAN